MLFNALRARLERRLGQFFDDHSHCGAKDVVVSIQAQDFGVMRGIVSLNIDLFVFGMRQNLFQRSRQKCSGFSILQEYSVFDRAGSTLEL